MKHRILLLFVVLLAFAAQAQDKWTGLSRYTLSDRAIIDEINYGKRVVLMGNSITDYWVSKRPEFFADHKNFIGRGISGQTSYQMLVRFRQDVLDLKPKVVVINAGINDIAENQSIPYSEDLTMGNIMSMAELAKAHKIKVILSSVMPTDKIYWNKKATGVQIKIMRLNERIRQYAEANGYPYIDYYSAMVKGASRGLNPAYTDDGLHPNVEGYKVMEPLLLEAVRKYVK